MHALKHAADDINSSPVSRESHDRQLVVVTSKEMQRCINKGNEEQGYIVSMDVNDAGLKIFHVSNSFMRKEMHPIFLLSLKDTQNIFL